MTGTADRSRLTVIIPTYNDAHCLELTLRSLTRQTIPRELFEVVIMRDGPGPGYEAIGNMRTALNLRVETLPERRGRSAARNAALAMATGRIIVFLDSDCYADPDLLARHNAFHECATVPRVLLGKRYEIDWPHLGFLLHDQPIPAELLAPDEYRDLKFLGADDSTIEQCLQTPWLFAHTNNASVPADVLTAVGGFNEDFGTRWGWEDLELFYRVYQHLGSESRSFVFDQDAVCYHLPQYRNVISEYMDFFANESTVKRLHPHLDWEFHSLRLSVTVAAKVRHYRNVIRSCLESGACRIPAVWGWAQRLLADHGMRNVLWIGTGTADVPLPEATLTFDYQAPVSATNLHLIGTAIPAADGAFDAVVSVDFWRCLQWGDLCDFVREALRVANELVLVRTPTAELPHRTLSTDSELDYLVRAFGPHFELAIDGGVHDEVSAITLRRPTAQSVAGSGAQVQAASPA